VWLVAVMGVLGLVAALGAARVKAASVEYTWSLVSLGQDGWIGGPLFEDGTVGGGGAFSANNGKLRAHFDPTTWSEDAGGNLTICFDITIVRGRPDALPPSLCIGPTPPTGTPTHLELLGQDHIFRITEIH
jgi:hypothetical protein